MSSATARRVRDDLAVANFSFFHVKVSQVFAVPIEGVKSRSFCFFLPFSWDVLSFATSSFGLG
jgi:hypothetical protein